MKLPICPTGSLDTAPTTFLDWDSLGQIDGYIRLDTLFQ